ncbi:MAG: sugar ABC transporter permease [Candidatus Bathyarchaeia archaeon]
MPFVKRVAITFGTVSSIPLIFFFIFFMIIPLINSFSLGLSDVNILLDLFRSTIYINAFRNLLIFLLGAIPIKFVGALFISGFLLYYRRSIIGKVASALYLVPWALPTVPAALAFRWSLDYDYGLFNKILTDLGLPRIPWLLKYEWAMLSIILFHVWKWMPMWTLLLYAGRQSIPEEFYEAAEIDGASLFQRFCHITLPLIIKLYAICVLLSTIWSIGEFEAIWLVTMAGPAGSTHTITTLGIQQVFQYANLIKGINIFLSILPFVSALMLFLMILFGRR